MARTMLSKYTLVMRDEVKIIPELASIFCRVWFDEVGQCSGWMGWIGVDENNVIRFLSSSERQFPVKLEMLQRHKQTNKLKKQKTEAKSTIIDT